jgi:hypothetical protein
MRQHRYLEQLGSRLLSARSFFPLALRPLFGMPSVVAELRPCGRHLRSQPPMLFQLDTQLRTLCDQRWRRTPSSVPPLPLRFVGSSADTRCSRPSLAMPLRFSKLPTGFGTISDVRRTSLLTGDRDWVESPIQRSRGLASGRRTSPRPPPWATRLYRCNVGPGASLTITCGSPGVAPTV